MTTARRGRDRLQFPARGRGPKLPDGVDLGRLCRTIEADRYRLGPYRRERVESVRQLAGMHYGENANPVEVPVNLIGLYIQVMTQALIDNNPRVMYSTFDAGQAAAVDAMQQWANDQIAADHMAETFKRVLLDALFWVGLGKVGLSTPVDAALGAWDVVAGQPFFEAVDPDDFVCDTSARRFDRCAYLGERVRIPVAMARDFYHTRGQDPFEASDFQDINYGGDDRVHTLGATPGRYEELEDHCDLWELYLPRHRVVVTLRDAGNGTPDAARPPVRVQHWVGPVTGPYHILGFGTVPGNLQPLAPIPQLVDLHKSYNNVYRKLLRRTRDAKQLVAYDGTAADSAERVKAAMDGEMVRVDNLAKIQQFETTSPTSALVTMSESIRAMFNFVGGNLELLGGRKQSASTATQEKMLAQNAAAGVGGLDTVFLGFVQGVMEAMNWYWWHHPTLSMRSSWSPQALPDQRVPRVVGPERRHGPEPRVRVDPYSLPRQTPQSRLQYITQVMQTVAPMMQLLAQQGQLPDMAELLKLFSKYGDEPDLARVFSLAVPPDPNNTPGGDHERTLPLATTRTYQRIGTGGDSGRGEAASLATDIANMDGPANPNSGALS